MKLKVPTIIIAIVFNIIQFSITPVMAADTHDLEVYSAFDARDFDAFVNGVSLGGNPNSLFENSRDGWVMCAATEEDRKIYLDHLLESKFDPNFRQKDVAARISSPLLCAISYGNFEAVESLVANGADPTLKHCQPCSTKVDTSAVWMAIISSKYEIANYLYINTEYSKSKTVALIDLIEKFPFPISSSESVHRVSLISSIRANGYEVSVDE